MSATMSPSLGVPPRRHELGARWRVALAALLFALVALLILYRDTAIAMATIWFRSDTFAHALLVPPIVLWLLWRQRERLAAITPRANPWMLLPIAAPRAMSPAAAASATTGETWIDFFHHGSAICGASAGSAAMICAFT